MSSAPHVHRFWTLLSALALFGIGVLALLVPWAAGRAATAALSILVVVAGAVHAIHSLGSRRLGAFAYHALIAVAYILGGGYLLLNPSLRLASFTLLVGVLFVVEGALRILAYNLLKQQYRSGWLLADGILTLVLGAFITTTWAASAPWVIGTLIGLNLVFSGVSRLMHLGSDEPHVPGSALRI